MKIQNVFASLMIASLIPAVAFAEETPANESKAKIEKPKTTVPGDIDNEITNNYLRASTGAKSDWSFSSNFAYTGSSVLTPFSTERVQLNSQNNADPTNVSGQMAIKYRVTKHDSLLAGFGVQYTPSYLDGKGNSVGAETTASTPYLDYNRAFRTGSVQHVMDVIISKYTASTDLEKNMSWGFDAAEVFMVNVGKTPLEIGGVIAYHQDFLSGQMLERDAKTNTLGPSDDYKFSQILFEPIAEYAFNDTYNFRTVWRMLIVNQSAADRTYWKAVSQTTESVGVGIAVTRDVFLYPNLQWAWNRIAPDATTVGFSANINL